MPTRCRMRSSGTERVGPVSAVVANRSALADAPFRATASTLRKFSVREACRRQAPARAGGRDPDAVRTADKVAVAIARALHRAGVARHGADLCAFAARLHVRRERSSRDGFVPVGDVVATTHGRLDVGDRRLRGALATSRRACRHFAVLVRFAIARDRRTTAGSGVAARAAGTTRSGRAARSTGSARTRGAGRAARSAGSTRSARTRSATRAGAAARGTRGVPSLREELGLRRAATRDRETDSDRPPSESESPEIQGRLPHDVQ